MELNGKMRLRTLIYLGMLSVVALTYSAPASATMNLLVAVGNPQTQVVHMLEARLKDLKEIKKEKQCSKKLDDIEPAASVHG